MSVATTRAAINAAFRGVDGSAVVIIAIVALISTIRRSINWILEPPFLEWLFVTSVNFIEDVILDCVLDQH